MVEVIAIGAIAIGLVRTVFSGLAELRVAEGIKERLQNADPMNPNVLLPHSCRIERSSS